MDPLPKSILAEVSGDFSVSFKKPLITLPLHRTSL